jgi:hypothetical protein
VDGGAGWTLNVGMAFEGDVATFPLGDLLGWLAGRGATGILSLTRGMTARRFHLRAGKVVLVSSSEQEMLLGQLLVERKLLAPEALAKALAGRGRSRARLGRLLTRGGLVAPGELEAILAEKVRRLLGDALTWDEGRFFYDDTEALPETEASSRRARREDQRAIAVLVDLKTALEQITRDAEARPAVVADRYLLIDDSDVVESAPAVSR